MADDVMNTTTDAQPAPPASTAAASGRASTESRAERARRAAYRSRFTLLYVLLALVAGAAVGALLVLVGRGSPAPAPPWSAWQPTGSSERREAQIAAQIGDKYHLPTGHQLVAVIPGSPTVTSRGTTYPVSAIAVLPNTSRGQAEANDINAVSAADTVMYQLCGLGNACSIREGQPSLARAALLRREALELALYTFKYAHDANSVLVLLPPSPVAPTILRAVFLERSDVNAELAHPLAETLPSRVTPGVGEMTPTELRVVDRLTLPRFYRYGYTLGQDGSQIMVLVPDIGP